jgi:hypothetical protein
MNVNMILAQNDQYGVRIFIGCDDMAVEFGAWLMHNGWKVTITGDVKSEEVPRTPLEVEMATALCRLYEQHLAMH